MDVDLKSESTLSDDVGHEAKVRVLSYNFNILPRGCGGYQHERIDTFLSAVDKYDVVLLQEVYATSIFPYALQKRFCYQKMLLDGLKAKGFPYYAISRQPSYQTMMRVGVVSDSGLVIASRFPIWHRGSYTFRHKSTRGDASAPKGCLFAEIEVPSKGTPSMNQRVLFFNVHMRPEESSPTHSSQVFQLKQCMKTVLGQLSYRNDDDTNSSFSNTPFVVSGDFNIHGIDANNAKLTTKLNDFMTELQSLGNVQDVVFCTLGTHLPTRPPNRFFPTQSRLEKYETTPQCQDYLLYNEAVLPIDARMEKFVVGSRRPYTYLSDHFGIATTIALNPAGQHALLPRSPSRLQLPSFVESAHHELSNPSSNVHMEVFLASIVAWLALSANWLQVCIIAIAAAIFQYTRYRTTTRVIFSRRAPIVTDEVVAGRAETTIPTTGASSKSAEVSGRQYASLQEMWLHAVSSFRGSPCIGSAREVGSVEWMSFDAVDKRARHFGAGLAALGLTAGSLIGVECEASEDAAILDLACILYGYVTVPLSGKRTTIRTLLDQHNIHVVFAGRSSVPILLNCRSTSLETVITVGSTLDEEDVQQAVGLSITLIPSSSVELKGRSAARPAFPRLTDATLFSMTMDNVSTSDLLNLVPVTHGDVLRDLEVLRRTEVLPDGSVKERMLWYSPFASLFNRMCVFGLLSYGHSVATSDSSHLQETLERVQPTLLVASPSLFSTSYVQHRRSKDRGYRLPRWLADRVFQLRSYLIFVQGRDSEILRYLFFRSFAQQLGGAVRRIVLNTAHESTPFYLVEHIAVCYAPVVREVSYLHTVGVCTIDGAPAPNLRVQLRCFNELSEKSGLGELVIHRDEKEQLLEVAAKWETTDRTLTFLGPPQGVLWPVEYEYAIASELERSFASSRYVNDVFVHCDALKPIIVVVNPNRDTVEFEWMQEHDQSKGNKALSWTDLVHYATDVIMEDLKCIAAEQKLHPSQIPSLVHLHPHAFRDHLTFLTPYGKIRRGDVSRYFASVFSRLYEDGGNSVSPGLTDDNLSEGECSTSSHPLERKLRELRVPITIDIGGTFAKITYITPPGAHDLKLPTFFVREASSLSERLGVRSFRFFRDREAAEKELQQNPKSRTGTLHFAKIPSSHIPQMAEFLAREQLVHTYKDECVQSIRATGGGAFKYANLARRTLGVKLEVVKEMDAVIKGLNLIIQLAAESIFTVEPTTGTHLPHKLVSSGDGFSPFPYLVFNMGSGISFIKCLGPDGSHVRVGGSPIGGATFWGLIRKMTSLTSWEEVMEIMRLDGPGDNKNVDLLVGDIYGYNAKDLPAMLSCETVASSFGKFGVDRRLSEVPRTASEHFAAEDNGVVLSPRSNPTNRTFSVNAEAAVGNATSIDIVRSLLNMIAVNVTQLAYLHSRVHGVRNVFFTGGFVRDNPIVWSLISTAMQYWSGGEYHAHFLEHDGYLGALGCAVLNTEDEA